MGADVKTALEQDRKNDKKMSAKEMEQDIADDKKQLAKKKKGVKTVLDNSYRGK